MIRELRAKRARIIANAQALAGSKRFNRDDAAKFDKMMAEADRLKGQVDRIDLVEREEREMARAIEVRTAAGRGIPGERPMMPEDRALSEAFSAYLRGGLEELRPDQRAQLDARRPRNAAGIATGPSGGFTVPDGFMRVIVDAQKAYGGMLQASNIVETPDGRPLPVPTDDDTSNEGAIIGENVAIGVGPDVTFGSVNLGGFTYSSKPIRVSHVLLEDSAFDLEAYLGNRIAVRIGRILNQHFTTGTGASQPAGIVTDALSGVTAASSTTITSDELIDLEHSVDPAYRKNARFMLSDDALRVVRKLKDSLGHYIWQPNTAGGEPDTILGHPYTLNQDIATIAPSAKTVLFGDFSHYFVCRVAGVRLLRLTERYADSNQVAFLAFQRWDGALIDAGTHPVKFLQMAA